MNKSSVCTYKYNNVVRDKVKYKSAEEGMDAARLKNSRPQTLHKYWVYKCTTCHHFHIGNTGKLLEKTTNSVW